MKYRKDIDGLRAIAVLGVLFFHAKLPGFSGGFVGVDVFFVISGYLITGMMVHDSRSGGFSFCNFYARRIRRIVPALLVVYLASAALAVLLMLPTDAAEFARSLRSSAWFTSNIFFYNLADYFSGASDLKPLLHTWSLSIEEQFYLLWPLLFWMVTRWRDQLVPPFTVVVGALSLVALVSASASGEHREAAFFLTPFRVWELMLGASIVLLPALPRLSTVAREISTALGFLLIIGSVLLIDETRTAPGLATIPACFGTALLLLTGWTGQPLVTRFLSSGPMVGVGLISYSLYLWHWPLLSFARYQLDRPLLLAEIGGLLSLSLILALLTYRYVEQPARRVNLQYNRHVIGAGLASLGALTLIGHQMDKGGGWTFNFDPRIRQLETVARAENIYRRACNGQNNLSGNERSCTFGRAYSPGRYDIVIFGDSHGNHYTPTVEAMAEHRGWSGRQVTVGGCLALLGYYEIVSPYANELRCRLLREAMVRFVEENPHLKLVVLAHRWSIYTGIPFEWHSPFSLLGSKDDERSAKRSYEVMQHSIKETLDFFEKKGIRVLLLGEVPPIGINPMQCLARAFRNGQRPQQCGRSFEEVHQRLDPVNALLFDGTRQRENVVFFSPLDVMCDHQWCSAVLDDTPMYRDDNHLNLIGASKLAGPIQEALARRDGWHGWASRKDGTLPNSQN